MVEKFLKRLQAKIFLPEHLVHFFFFIKNNDSAKCVYCELQL